jgi:tRNA-2-methylthio-N6-dimethylallyladenosine synthase
MSAQKTYYIEIWGCQMNVADAAAAARRLESLGYSEAPSASEADLVLLETCCVREKPEHKIYSRLGELRPFQQARPSMRIGVCGCMAQKEGLAIMRNASLRVDLVVGPRRLSHLPELLEALERTGKPQIDVNLEDSPDNTAEQNYDIYRRQGTLKAFVNIIEGCNYRCAYCIVPSVRGKFTSRQPTDVLEEVHQLVDAGIKEVTLLGQSVLAYGRDHAHAFDIVHLFTLLQQLDGLERIRFTTNHPLEVNERIIDAVADTPKVMEHFHMPIQAGDDRLLKAMKRGYTVARYAEVLAAIRARIPGVSVTSDIIIGFPGETEEIFAHCLETYQQLCFDQQFMFVFSPRPGTPAATMSDQVQQAVKVQRMTRVVELQNACSATRNAAQIGDMFEVMVEGPSERNPDKYAGRARNDKALVFTAPADSPPRRGEIVQIIAEAGHLWGFSGRMMTR